MSWWLDQIGRVPLLTPAQEIELGTRVQTWLNHPAGPDHCPPGIRRSGRRAREQFVAANLRLAVSFVAKVSRRHGVHHHDDLVQAANEGLIRAVEKYDPTRGYRFSTYAYWWIRQAVTRYMELHGRLVAIPGIHSKNLARLDAVTRRLRARHGREPSPAEIADALDISPELFEQLLINARPIASLDALVRDDDNREIGDAIGCDDPSLEQQEEESDRWRQAEELRQLIERLPESDQQILRAAWGMDGVDLPRAEVAAAYGMTTIQLERYLERLQAQLRRMTVQAVLIAVAPTPPPLRQPGKRRRRPRVEIDQLTLDLVAPAPIESAAASAAD